MYDQYIESISEKLDQKAAMCSGEICAIDHSHKITKQIMKVEGESVFTAAATVTNEAGEARILAFVATKAHSQIEPALIKMEKNLTLYGHEQPKVFYTDNPAADKQFLEKKFPSLLKDVVSVEKYSNLKKFARPDDIPIQEFSTAAEINDALAKITDDLDLNNEDNKLVVGFDAEWNVDLTQRGAQQPTSIIQIAYKKLLYIFQVIGSLVVDWLCTNITISDWTFQGQLSCCPQDILGQSTDPKSWN